MVRGSWVDLLMRNWPMRWDSYWWTKWRRIAAVVNKLTGDIHDCRTTDSSHMPLTKPGMILLYNRRTTLNFQLKCFCSCSVSNCVCHYQPTESWSFSGCGVLTVEPQWVSACCYNCAFVSHLAEVQSSTDEPPQHSSTDGVLSKPLETRVKQALPSPQVKENRPNLWLPAMNCQWVMQVCARAFQTNNVS